MKVTMLTTIDNPADPFDQFRKWYKNDVLLRHNTCGKIASIALTSPKLSDEENKIEIEKAIDLILENDFEGIYKKVTRELPDPNDLEG